MDILFILLLCVSITLFCLGIYGLSIKRYTINCDYQILCEHIVHWAIDTIPPFSSKNKLSIVLVTKNNNKMANYFPYQKKIEIYMNNHHNVNEIVDSLLHEITHYKQHIQNPRNCMSKYKKLLKEYGYDNHPMEIEATNVAGKHGGDCLSYLKKNGLIV